MADELAVRIDDLQRLILKHKPNIVHICGHGSGEQGLVFQDDNMQPQLASTVAISGLFALSLNHVKCVVLNACYSEVQARAIGSHIDHVIGMQQAIQDKSAITFAKGFYQALGYGQRIEESYNWSCNAIQFSLGGSDKTRKFESVDIVHVDVPIPDDQKPVLLLKGEVKKPTQFSGTAFPDETARQIGNKIANRVTEGRKQVSSALGQEQETQLSTNQSKRIPDFINHLLESYFSDSALRWSLCFTDEDESTKLGELTTNLRNKFSGTGKRWSKASFYQSTPSK
jgi:hypothetical protein